MDLIGKTYQQAQEALNRAGITNIKFVENFKNPLPNSTLLVTACKITNKTAQVTLGSFKLEI